MPRANYYNFLTISAIMVALCGNLPAAAPDRITRPVNLAQTKTLSGHLQLAAVPQNDRGAVEPSMKMDYMVLVVHPSTAQQSDLDTLLADQQNPSSPRYHQWLSPEDFGTRFGLSSADHSKLVSWLTSQGFSINETGRGRNWIAFTGNAGQVSRAFRTPIHRFQVNGETHYANTAEPSIPDAFSDVVGGLMGLNDFPLQSYVHGATPFYTSGTSHYLAPQDLATIYNLGPLYQAGFDGTNQNIVVVGQSAVSIADIHSFRTRFGLPVNDPKMLLYSSTDPGFTSSELEGDLDLEWAGAIAPKANLWYIYGPSAFSAMVAAINSNVAPIITVSYGSCEIGLRLNYWRAIAQQANAQGITILNSSGDSGAAGCDPQGNMPYAAAGRSVSFPANLPEVTGVGGTQFVEGSGSYWSPANSSTLASALSYIPEAAWNESGVTGLGSTGGGASQFHPKPSWQNGPGVPNDHARDVPDISLSAAGHDGYLIYYEGGLYSVGGTSASSPSFAAILAILSQYQVAKGFATQPGLGNVNPQLYRLAQSAPTAFHDVTAGDNKVSCVQGSPDCLTGTIGYAAGPGYDMATGLGTVDANNLITLWNSKTQGVNTTLFINTSRATLNDTVGMTALIVPASGTGTPSGTVSFSVNGVALGTSPLHNVGGIQEADLFFPAYLVGGIGTVVVAAEYSGDSSFSSGGVTKNLAIVSPTGAAAIVPTAPDTVWPADPDAQGLSWQTTLSLREFAGVAAVLTGFTIDGVTQPLAQYFPSNEIPASGTLSATVVLRNLATPTVRTFGFTGVDALGQKWSRQISVNYFSLPPGSVPVVSATPLVIARDPNANPGCQWSTQLHIDEAGGNVNLLESTLHVGGVDLTSQIPAIFGTPRLATWAGLQGTVCFGDGITPPASETIHVVTTQGTAAIPQDVTVSFTDAAANPTTLSASPSSISLPVAGGERQGDFSQIGGQIEKATLSLQLADPAASWTVSVFPANRTTGWLGLSQFSGKGSSQIALTASGVGYQPGAYRASLVFQSATAVPQTITVPVMFVNGPGIPYGEIKMVANTANYSSAVAPGMVVAVFGSNLTGNTALATTSPLPYSLSGVSAAVNGIAAPIQYVSPNQINVQIPYETGAGPAVLGINDNGQVLGFQFQISAAAPGILPAATVTAGGVTTVYFVGGGDVQNLIRTGFASSSSTTNKPLLPLSVTVGGQPAFIQSVGLTSGQVGVTQVKFTIPSSVPSGVQPIVVTVNGVASPSAPLTVK